MSSRVNILISNLDNILYSSPALQRCLNRSAILWEPQKSSSALFEKKFPSFSTNGSDNMYGLYSHLINPTLHISFQLQSPFVNCKDINSE